MSEVGRERAEGAPASSALVPPLAGRWVRRPTARGAAAAVLGITLLTVGLLWRYPGVVAFGGALLVLAASATLTVLRRMPVRIDRRVWPLEVTRFQPCEAQLRIERRGGLLPLPVDTTDHVDGAAVPIVVPPLSAGRSAEVRYAIPTHQRGVRTVGPVDVHRRALAGLAETRAALGTTIEVRVLPRVLPVRGLPTGVRRAYIGTDERVPHGGTDLIGLREYLPGDDLRRLHWATSARSGKLMVREDADPSSAHLTLLVDDRTGSYAGQDADSAKAAARLEEAVEVAASLAVAAAESDHGVRLLTVSGHLDRTMFASPGVPADARDIVSALAEVSAHDLATTPGPLPVAGLDIVVAVTGAAADLGPLVTEAGRAAVGVVAVVDPASAGVLTSGAVAVLRGARAADLLARWDTAVVGGA